MKKILLFLLMLPVLAMAQSTSTTLTTQVDNTIRGKTYTPGAASDMFQAIINAQPSGTASGTNTYAVTLNGTRLTDVSQVNVLDITFTNANSSGTMTLAISNSSGLLATLAIKGNDGNDLAVGAIKAGGTYRLKYNGTNLRVMNDGSSAGGFTNPMTTAGDIIYGGASGTATRLATGSGFLKGGTTPSWSSVNMASDVTGTLPVGNGGTGATTITGLVKGNGTGAFTAAVSNTDYQAPITFGTGVVTALGVNIGSAGAPVLFNGVGGTPSSVTLTNGTGLPLTTGVTGVLPIANGGTNNSTAYTSGSIPYSNGTSLTQNNQNLNWDNTNGIFRIQNAGGSPIAPQNGTMEHIVGQWTNLGTTLLLGSYQSASTAVGPMLKSRAANGTIASSSAVTTGQPLLILAGDGFGDNAFHSISGGAAEIDLVAGSTHTNSNAEALIMFKTTPNGSTTAAERFRIGSLGQWGIAGANWGNAGDFYTSGGSGATTSWFTAGAGVKTWMTTPSWTNFLAAVTGTAPYIATGATAGGDLSGTYPNPVVAKLQTIPFSATTPTTGQVPQFNGVSWSPTSTVAGSALTCFNCVITGNGSTALVDAAAVVTDDAQDVTGAITLTASSARNVDCVSGGSYTVTLPALASVSGTGWQGGGKVFHIANLQSSGTITIAQNGSETIDGSTSDPTLATQFKYLRIQAKPSGWIIRGSN